MGVKVIRDESRVDEFIKAMEELERTIVVIGVLDGKEKHKNSNMTVLGIANIHEFGYAGVGKDGIFRNIPERSFIRASADENKEKIFDKFEGMVVDVVSLKVSPKTLFNAIGLYCVGVIQDYIKSMTTPALSNITIQMKGSSKLLIDSSQLIDSITYEIRKK